MQDIFDKLTETAGGDIFDQVAAQPTGDIFDEVIASQPEDSWPKAIGKVAMQGLTTIPKSVGAFGRLTNDLMGLDMTQYGTPDLYDVAQDADKYWQPEVREGSAKKYVTDVVRVISEMGSTAALTGGAGLLPAMSVGAGLQKFEESRGEGYGLGTSIQAGGEQAALEYATEKIPLGILNKAGMGFVKRILGHAVSDIPGELIATLGEMKVIDENTLGKSYTPEQYKQAIIDTLIVSAGAGVGMAGGAGVLHQIAPEAETPAPKGIEEIDVSQFTFDELVAQSGGAKIEAVEGSAAPVVAPAPVKVDVTGEFEPEATIANKETFTIKGDETVKYDKGTLEEGEGAPVAPGKSTAADVGGYKTGTKPTTGITETTEPKKGEAPPEAKAIEMPELVEIAKGLTGGKYPKIRRKLRAAGGRALGLFSQVKGAISLKADIFKDPEKAAKVMAHEIGHVVDWLPSKDLKRGNILGRVASLKGYLKTLLESYPDSPLEVIKPKERRKMRQAAKKAALAELGMSEKEFRAADKAGRVPVNEKTKEIYKQKLDKEIKARGLYAKAEIMAELKDLTQTWKPFDDKADAKFTKYRYSSIELYGDAISVLLNDPNLLRKTAPKFHESLFRYLERKPEVEALYMEIQKRLKDPGAVKETRQVRARSMFARGEAARAAKYAESQSTRDLLERLKEDFVDANEALIRRIKQARKRGETVSAEDNPVFALEEATYTSSQVKEYLRDTYDMVLTPLEKAGLTQDDMADVMFHERVIHERGEVANPQGFTPDTSKAQLEHLKKKLGADKYAALEGFVETYRGIRKKTIIPMLKASGAYSEALMKKIEENDHYAAFNVVDFLEEKNGPGSGITSHIFKQEGTLSEIESPFTATILKDIALIRVVNMNKAAEKTIKFLQEHYGDEIRPADKRWNGTTQVAVDPRGKNLGMIRVLKDGKVQGYYVDQYVADSFNKNPSKTGMGSEVLRRTNIIWKEIFVNRNPGFWLFNLKRDYSRAWVNLPGMATPFSQWAKFLPEYMKAIKPAFQEAFGVSTDITREMNEKKMLISVESRWGLSPEDVEMERMLQSYGLKKSKYDNLILKKFGKLWDHWGNIGQGIERIPKIAGFNYLKKHTNLSDAEIGHIVRTQVGSPDFLRRGNSYNTYNNILLFSNAIKEGWRGDFEAAQSNPSEYALKRARGIIVPRLVMYAAAIGLLGDWMKEFMMKVSPFDAANYIVIPLGMTEGGKAVYLRVPQDETGRFIGGILWKTLTSRRREDIADLADYMAGQAPALTPTIGITIDTVQYLSGKNPYDWFRGREAIPKGAFEAGGTRSLKAFGKHIAKKGGAGAIYKFKGDDVEKIKTELEKVLDFPIASNVIGRFIKVTDVGERAVNRRVTDPIKKETANLEEEVKDRMISNINRATRAGRETTEKDLSGLLEELRAEGLVEPTTTFMQFAKRYRRYSTRVPDNANIDAVIFAGSNKEKAALLTSYKNRMSVERYDKIKKQLQAEGHISGAVIWRVNHPENKKR